MTQIKLSADQFKAIDQRNTEYGYELGFAAHCQELINQGKLTKEGADAMYKTALELVAKTVDQPKA